MTYPKDYVDFIKLFNRRKFFRSHEVLEKLWLKTEGENKLFYQGLIQTAVALHHLLRSNDRGAQVEYRIAKQKLESYPARYLGINVTKLLRELKECMNQPERHTTQNLPMIEFEP